MQDKIITHRHSDEIQDIITKVPSWIVRWGIVIFGAILLMVVAISAIVHYPDTIKAPIKFQAVTNSKSADVIGLISIPQSTYPKVKLGQRVLIHLAIYPSAQPKAVITTVPEDPEKNGLFVLQVKMDNSSLAPPIKLKSWMTGNAEIITQDVTVLQRITASVFKIGG